MHTRHADLSGSQGLDDYDGASQFQSSLANKTDMSSSSFLSPKLVVFIYLFFYNSHFFCIYWKGRCKWMLKMTRPIKTKQVDPFNSLGFIAKNYDNNKKYETKSIYCTKFTWNNVYHWSKDGQRCHVTWQTYSSAMWGFEMCQHFH